MPMTFFTEIERRIFKSMWRHKRLRMAKVVFLSFFFFPTVSCYAAQSGLEFMILFSQPPKWGEYRYVPRSCDIKAILSKKKMLVVLHYLNSKYTTKLNQNSMVLDRTDTQTNENRIDYPEVTSCIYSQLIFNKVVKSLH
jgi:hypothetical protein